MSGARAAEMALPGVPARPRRFGERLAPTRGWPPPIRKAVPFSGLMLFTFVLFVAPHNLIPALEPLKLAKVSIALAVLGYAMNRAVTGRPLTVMTQPVRRALLLTGLAILSIPAGFWPGGSVSVLLDLFGKSIVVFLLLANIVDTDRRFRLLVGSLIAYTTLAAIVAIFNFATGRLDVQGVRIAGYESPLALNPNDLALTLNMMLALAIGLHQASRRRTTRMLLVGAMALMVGGVIVSFSRSGFVTLVGMLAVWTFQNVRRRGVRALLMLVPVALVVMLMLPSGYTERLATLTDAESDTTGSISERWETMVLATKMMLTSPVVGVGLGNYVHVSVAQTGSAVDAHNAYLKLGAELGIPAMVVYILFILSAIATARAVRVFFHRRREGWELGRLAGGVELSLIAFAIGAFFSPVSYHFYLFYPAGLAVALFTIAARVPVPARHAGGAA